VQTGFGVTVPRCFYSDCFVSCHNKTSKMTAGAVFPAAWIRAHSDEEAWPQ
jgi:hypothetical protein